MSHGLKALLAHSSSTPAYIGIDFEGRAFIKQEDGSTLNLEEVQSVQFNVTSYAPPGYPRDGVADWTTYIQDAIDDAIAVNGINIARLSGVVKFPPGRYKITAPLRIMGEWTGSVWNFCSVTLEGDNEAYGNAFNASSIEPTYLDGPAIAIQGAKSVTIRNLALIGKNTFISTNAAQWVDAIAGHYNDANYLVPGARLNRYSPCAGIAVDPFNTTVPTDDRYPALTAYYTNTGTGGGSSQVLIENCSIYYFVAGIVVTPQPAGAMQNAEIFTYRNLRISDCRDALCVGQEQSRNHNVENGVWGNARTVINCVDYGAGRGQPPNIRGTMVGSCKYFFKVTPTWTAHVDVSGVYAENMISLGFPSRMRFSGCEFHFPPTPSGKPAIPRIVHFGNNSFAGVHFFTSSNAEPQWHIPTNYARVGYSDCVFSTPNGFHDSSPRHWFAGLRHLVDYERCEDFVAPSEAVLGSRFQIDALSNLFNQALLPGTVFSATGGTEAMRVLDTQWPLNQIGNTTVTIYADGHAEISGANLDQNYAVGDIVETLTQYDAAVWEAQAISPIPHTTALGKVSAVTPTLVTISHVPFFMCPSSGSASASHFVLLRWLPRVHLPATGQINFSGDMTQLTSVTPDPTANNNWRVGDRINGKKQGSGESRIPAGTYVKAINGQTITLSKAATGGSGTETLDLFGATVYSLTKTQVP